MKTPIQIQVEKRRLMEFVKKKVPDKWDLIDVEAIYDSTLKYNENKNIIEEKIENLIPIEKKITKSQIETNKIIEETLTKKYLEEEERQAELDFMKSLGEIEKDKTTKVLEEIYFIPKNYAKMVARGFSNGLIFVGCGGLGKTYNFIRAFQEEKKKFVYATGFTTPLQLYQFLYKHRKEHILFDDDRILDNRRNLDMLKSALYSPKGTTRIVSYDTTSPRLSAPSKFVFEGTINIILNEFKKKNEDLRAVADRVLFYEFKISYKDKIRVLFELAKQKYEDLSCEERQMIVNWIKENTNEATENLNLRLLFKIYNIYRFDKDNWKKLAEKLIQNDKKLLKVKKLLDKYKFEKYPVKKAENEWIRNGGSRATFYRLKTKLEED